MDLALAALALLVALQYSGGLIRLERSAPTAICWSLGPSYGDTQGGCSRVGVVMIYLT